MSAGHETWIEPRPQETQDALILRYLAFCICGWHQPAPTHKSSAAARAAKRHRQRV